MLLTCGTLIFTNTVTAGPQPTATEIFHLRTECRKLGKEIFQEKLQHDAENHVFTKYDEKINRCYVLIKSIYPGNKTVGFLYDAQSDHLIAIAAEDFGRVKGENVSPQTAAEYIDRIMQDGGGEK